MIFNDDSYKGEMQDIKSQETVRFIVHTTRHVIVEEDWENEVEMKSNEPRWHKINR